MLMRHRFPLPTDAEIEKLITQVYEGMPNPDQSRLSLIESKLLQKARKNKSQKNLNKIPWWIVLLLAGGLATAAWLAGERWFGNEEVPTTIKKALDESRIDMEENKVLQNNKIKQQGNEADNKSPIIFQREL